MQQEKIWFRLSSPIQICRMGYVNDTNHYPVKKKPPFWIFVLVESGQRTLYLDGKEIRIQARDFLFLPPGTEQLPLALDTHCAWFVHFYARGEQISPPETLDSDRLTMPIFGHLPTDFDCAAYIKYICKQYERPYIENSFCNTQLQSLFSMISINCQKHHIWRPDEASLREKMLKFIQANASRNLSAQDYEAEFKLSYHQLGARFKKQTGFTIKQYHQRLRMQNAAYMLQEGKSLQTTAQACGYDDYYFFIKCFKKEYGVPPGKYQKDNGLDVI